MYSALPLDVCEAFIPLAEEWGVSEVARSDRGFMSAYRSLGHITPEWRAKRQAFIKRHVAQVKARGESLWRADGSPTRRHLALVMWAYSPTPAKLRRLLTE